MDSRIPFGWFVDVIYGVFTMIILSLEADYMFSILLF